MALTESETRACHLGILECGLKKMHNIIPITYYVCVQWIFYEEYIYCQKRETKNCIVSFYS